MRDLEVFWVTGRPCWVPTVCPIDIHQSDDAVLAEVDRVFTQLPAARQG